jgi:hypothetical protein
MVLEVNDTSKDKDIDDATSNIDFKRQYLLANWTWMTETERRQRKQQIKMMEDNREHLINAKIGKTTVRKRSLYDPIPQTEEEKQELLDLIDSV